MNSPLGLTGDSPNPPPPLRKTMYPDTAKLLADLAMLDRVFAHNRELIEANNRLVERARTAEHENTTLKAEIADLREQIGAHKSAES